MLNLAFLTTSQICSQDLINNVSVSLVSQFKLFMRLKKVKLLLAQKISLYFLVKSLMNKENYQLLKQCWKTSLQLLSLKLETRWNVKLNTLMVLILFLVLKNIVIAIGNQKNLSAEKDSQIFKTFGKQKKQKHKPEKRKKDSWLKFKPTLLKLNKN